MLLAALATVVLILAIALWRTLGRVREAERQLAELRRLRRDVEDVRDELTRGLAVTRQHLAAIAAGETLPRATIVAGAAWRDVQPAEALALYQATPPVFVLDVRTAAEYRNGHIPQAQLIPLDELEDRLGELPARDVPMLVHCAAGARSTTACEILGRHGWTRLLNLAGGLHGWTGPRVADEPPPAPSSAAAQPTAITFHGGPISEAQVVAAIRSCFDPEIPLNVYDLGLVYGIDIAETGINVRMTLTSEACPSARAIPEDVRRKIEALGQPNVQVDLVWDPPWHPSRISEDGKQKLGLES